VLAASAADHDLTWLLELYADTRTAPLEEGLVEAQLLVRAAIPPRSARKGAALRERWALQVGLTNSLGTRLADVSSAQAMAEVTVEEVHLALAAQATGLIAMRDDGTLEQVAGVGACEQLRDHTMPAHHGLVGRCLRERRVVLVGDVTLEPDYAGTAATRDIRSELDVPVIVDGVAWGVLTVQSTQSNAFDEGDASMVRSAAHQLSAGLRAAELRERLERAQLGTAEALKAALDARAAATIGTPSALVQRCEAVGRRLELSDADLSALRYAATLHDIGELGVPEAILNKPGPLTDEERPAIERHPLIGEGILSPVEFLTESLPLVRAAHERWDGTGYPDGLSGEEIPLGARILFACDSYDAMMTERPYRAALLAEEAKQELRQVAGTQLDPRVVDALLSVLDAGS
jgi:HD-GYP domain-containing protein (c-di-GMP phosphodiesterase class II)